MQITICCYLFSKLNYNTEHFNCMYQTAGVKGCITEKADRFIINDSEAHNRINRSELTDVDFYLKEKITL